MLVKRKFYDEIGGFDEEYWCGWEDIDMCQKAHQLWKEIWYAPRSVLYHYEGMTDGRMIAESQNFNIYVGRWVLSKA
jgi:GT2 family glycosyltransferase